MNGDILPPRQPRKVEPDRPTVQPEVQPRPGSSSHDIRLPEIDLSEIQSPSKKKPRPWVKWTIVGIVLLICVAAVSAWIWYVSALAPVNSDDDSLRRLHIAQGSSVEIIGNQLKEEGLIRSELAFIIYARSINAAARLQAGEYSLSPSESTQEITGHLVSGRVDQFTVTFLPGATLRRLPGETNPERTDIKSALLDVGYEEAEIEAAFSKDYDHPLFADRPNGADLEGYIYGETYTFASSSSVEQVLMTTFDEYYKVIEENNLVQGFKAQGLTLHEGIILASIIQREVSGEADQKQVAQIFLDRLELGMSLGSDVTFEYGAKKEGVTPDPSIDSPYNTRKFTGLPPGPISTPGRSALIAVANPAEGDYLYFVSGDDGKNYFARTNEEHEENVRKYCQKLCFGL